MEFAGESGQQLLGTPELAPVGKRIEMLRIERGLSKQRLAQAAGISRQQLWRVLAGKSELTSSLRERLALVLGTEVSVLHPDSFGASSPAWMSTGAGAVADATPTATTTVAAARPATVAEFVGSPAAVQALLSLLPAGDEGIALKRAMLDAIEDVAVARGIALPAGFFELRRGVVTRAI